jgi:hypothetical protein
MTTESKPHRFKGCILANPVRKKSYVGEPTCDEQLYELTVEAAQGLIPNVIGKPILNQHQGSVIGTVIDCYAENGKMMIEGEIFPGHDTSSPRIWMEQGAYSGLSLHHMLDTDEVKEVSVCWLGKRPGTFVEDKPTFRTTTNSETKAISESKAPDYIETTPPVVHTPQPITASSVALEPTSVIPATPLVIQSPQPIAASSVTPTPVTPIQPTPFNMSNQHLIDTNIAQIGNTMVQIKKGGGEDAVGYRQDIGGAYTQANTDTTPAAIPDYSQLSDTDALVELQSLSRKNPINGRDRIEALTAQLARRINQKNELIDDSNRRITESDKKAASLEASIKEATKQTEIMAKSFMLTFHPDRANPDFTKDLAENGIGEIKLPPAFSAAASAALDMFKQHRYANAQSVAASSVSTPMIATSPDDIKALDAIANLRRIMGAKGGSATRSMDYEPTYSSSSSYNRKRPVEASVTQSHYRHARPEPSMQPQQQQRMPAYMYQGAWGACPPSITADTMRILNDESPYGSKDSVKPGKEWKQSNGNNHPSYDDNVTDFGGYHGGY